MDLLQNSFHILTASPRDNKQRIMELADERSLMLDSNECMQARSDLTNPRKRLSAEAAWLPGIGPKRTGEVLSLLESSPADILAVDKLTSIARANLLAAGLARLPDYTPNYFAEWILEIARESEDIDPETLIVIINEERVVSGFPEVTDRSALETEIQERRRHYRQVIKSALDNLPAKERLEAVTVAVETATDIGEEQGPKLVHVLVDSYEVEVQAFLEKKEGSIKILVETLRAAVDAGRPDSVLAPMVNQLIQVVRNWDTIAQPIQVSTKSQGLDHEVSYKVAGLVRELAIYMFNDHSKLDFSRQLTNMLQEVFAEVGKVVELTDKDAGILEEIAEQRKQSRLLDPISHRCNTAIENTEKHPSSADKEAQEVIKAAPQLVANLAASQPSAEIFAQGKDMLALTLMHCAVVCGNKTGKWKICIFILEEALKYATSQEGRSRIQKNLGIMKTNEAISLLSRRETQTGVVEYLMTTSQNTGTVSSENSSEGSAGKWILGIVVIICVIIWVGELVNNSGSSNTKPTYNSSSPYQNYDPEVVLQYSKPSIGTNNVLSVSQIRWCIRESIRIEAIRDIIDTNEGIDAFNQIINDYNSRCGSYQYSQGSRQHAERDIEAYRSQIVKEAIRDASKAY